MVIFLEKMNIRQINEYKTNKNGNMVYSNASNDGHDDIISAAYFAFADFDIIEEVLPWTGLIGGVKSKTRAYSQENNPETKHSEGTEIDTKDIMLGLCIRQGYVPPTCIIDGQLVLMLTQKDGDACAGCNADRSKCGGRPKKC